MSDRVALVTGGSRGLGAAIARRLAREGAAVALTYAGNAAKAAEVVAAIQADGGKALAIQADSGDVGQVQAAVTRTVEAFGRLDILVNNAAVLTVAPIQDFALEDLDRMLAVNIKGVVVACQAAARHMGQGGRIINIGSVNSDLVPFAGGSIYAMTKSALVGLTKGLARDLAPKGITVNNVQPGPVDTDMNPADGPFAEHAKSIMALGRYGEADEVASLVAYLARPEAAYITGSSLKIDGGYAA